MPFCLFFGTASTYFPSMEGRVLLETPCGLRVYHGQRLLLLLWLYNNLAGHIFFALEELAMWVLNASSMVNLFPAVYRQLALV